MSDKLNKRIVLQLLRSVVLAASGAGKVYKLLFGRYDVRLSKGHEDQLANDLQRDLPFLFVQYGGKVGRGETGKYPRAFDYAVVIVDLDNLLFRFVRGRGDLEVQVAPKSAPENWQSLQYVLGKVEVSESFERMHFLDLEEVARALEPGMGRLREHFLRLVTQR